MIPSNSGQMRNEIIKILEHHHGKESAIRGKELAAIFGQPNDRRVRQVIRELIEDGYPIAASVDGQKGYYMARTKREVDEYLAVLRSRLIEDALRRRDFKKSAGHYLGKAEQGRLI